MLDWKTCGTCGQINEFVFRIEIHTQHCAPEVQCDVYICDHCLERLGVNPDNLAKAVAPESECPDRPKKR